MKFVLVLCVAVCVLGLAAAVPKPDSSQSLPDPSQLASGAASNLESGPAAILGDITLVPGIPTTFFPSISVGDLIKFLQNPEAAIQNLTNRLSSATQGATGSPSASSRSSGTPESSGSS